MTDLDAARPVASRWRGAQSATSLWTCVPMAALLTSGLLKFADLGQFEADLRTWDVLPEHLRDLALVVVPTVEVAVAGSWLLGFRQATARAAAFVLFATFTGAYFVQYSFGRPPSCGCVGLQLAFRESQSDALWLGVRNSVLCAMLLWPSRRRGGT